MQLEQACLLKDSAGGTDDVGLKLPLEARHTPESRWHEAARLLRSFRAGTRQSTAKPSSRSRETSSGAFIAPVATPAVTVAKLQLPATDEHRKTATLELQTE